MNKGCTVERDMDACVSLQSVISQRKREQEKEHYCAKATQSQQERKDDGEKEKEICSKLTSLVLPKSSAVLHTPLWAYVFVRVWVYGLQPHSIPD